MYTVSLRNLNAVAIFNAEPSSRGGVGALAWLISSPNGGSADVPSDFNITDEVGRRSGLVLRSKDSQGGCHCNGHDLDHHRPTPRRQRSAATRHRRHRRHPLRRYPSPPPPRRRRNTMTSVVRLVLQPAQRTALGRRPHAHARRRRAAAAGLRRHQRPPAPPLLLARHRAQGGDLSFPHSLAPSLPRSLAPSLPRSLARSLDRASIAASIDLSARASTTQDDDRRRGVANSRSLRRRWHCCACRLRFARRVAVSRSSWRR